MNKIKSIVFCLIIMFSFQTFANSETATITTTEETSMFSDIVSWYMDNMNYGTITLLMTVESTFIPFPSEAIVPPAVYKSLQASSDLNVILIILFATLGALCGALINYSLAFWLGRPLIHKFADSKIGRMCLLTSEKVDKAEQYFIKHGRSSTFIGRLVPGIRHLISIPAGLAKMKLFPFISYTIIGAGIWNICLTGMGYLAFYQQSKISQYNKELSYLMLVLGILFIIYLIYSGFIKKKKSKSAN